MNKKVRELLLIVLFFVLLLSGGFIIKNGVKKSKYYDGIIKAEANISLKYLLDVQRAILEARKDPRFNASQKVMFSIEDLVMAGHLYSGFFKFDGVKKRATIIYPPKENISFQITLNLIDCEASIKYLKTAKQFSYFNENEKVYCSGNSLVLEQAKIMKKQNTKEGDSQTQEQS